MAIIKHIASKNSHYSDSFKYLIYKHDEFTNEPLLDESGNMILRDEYLIDALNVTAPETFAAECIITNDKYKQNRYRQDIKSHHYIISFDPKDVTDNGLTVSMAQNIGMDFAARNFPGHEALIATHADGHNNSGNIHIHIVINSVRKNDVEMQPFMERASDSKAGYKHHLTNSYSDYIKKDLMNVCQEHGLYQVDLLNPSRNRITDAEYWKKRREISKGNTHFKTELDYLRDKISKVTSSSKDLKEFKDTLFFEYGITLYEKRGRYSYLLPDKSIPITGRRLGTDYEKEHIILSFGQIKEQPDIARIPVAALIDIDGNSKAQSNIYYKRALELKNIENLARMANVITNEHISSIEDLEKIVIEKTDSFNSSVINYKALNRRYKELNAIIRHIGQYWANKGVYDEYLHTPASKKSLYYDNNRSQIQLFEEARDYLAKIYGNNKLPSIKSLKEERRLVTIEKNEAYEAQTNMKKQYLEAQNLLSNLKEILNQEERSDHSHEVKLNDNTIL